MLLWLKRYVKSITAVLAFLALLGSVMIPTLRWLDAQIVTAADLEPIQDEMTEGFDAATKAILALTVAVHTTRLSNMELELRQLSRAKAEVDLAIERMHSASREVPMHNRLQQDSLQNQIDAIKTEMGIIRDTIAALEK